MSWFKFKRLFSKDEGTDNIIDIYGRQHERRAPCPRCFYPGHVTDRYSVDWDDMKKEFRISILMYCLSCRYEWNEELVKTLPLVVAQESQCSCGANLILVTYSIVRVNEDIEFRGVYQCKSCLTKEETVLSKLRDSVVSIWKKTKKIEIGPTGLKYEKESEPKS